MEDIIVLDNFLPTYIQDKLEDLCYNITWELSKDSSFGEKYLKENKTIDNFEDSEQFVSLFWDINNINKVLPKYLNLGHYFLLPLQISCIKNNIIFSTENNLRRAKVNLTQNNNQDYPTPKFPHRDIDIDDNNFLENNFWAIIYYVNDSDGDTIIYNETEKLEDLSKYTIKQRISPKKGRIVFIKGHLFHSASNPSNKYSKRIVINYNLIF